MKTLLAAATLALSVPILTFSSATRASDVQPAQEKAIIWLLNKEKSSIRFTATYGGKPLTGQFTAFDATIAFDPLVLEASHVTATIDTGSVTSDDSNAASTLPSADFLSSKVFPKAIFTADSFKALESGVFNGTGNFIATGTLELKGVKQPVELPFTLTIEGKTAKMTGKTGLKRLDYNVGEGEWKSTDSIADEVLVEVTLEASRP